MEIFLEGIILKPWTITDAPQLALIADNKNISDNIRDGLPNPYSEKTLRLVFSFPKNSGDKVL